MSKEGDELSTTENNEPSKDIINVDVTSEDTMPPAEGMDKYLDGCIGNFHPASHVNDLLNLTKSYVTFPFAIFI